MRADDCTPSDGVPSFSQNQKFIAVTDGPFKSARFDALDEWDRARLIGAVILNRHAELGTFTRLAELKGVRARIRGFASEDPTVAKMPILLLFSMAQFFGQVHEDCCGLYVPFTRAEIAAKVGIGPKTAYPAMRDLEEVGAVRRISLAGPRADIFELLMPPVPPEWLAEAALEARAAPEASPTPDGKARAAPEASPTPDGPDARKPIHCANLARAAPEASPTPDGSQKFTLDFSAKNQDASGAARASSAAARPSYDVLNDIMMLGAAPPAEGAGVPAPDPEPTGSGEAEPAHRAGLLAARLKSIELTGLARGEKIPGLRLDDGAIWKLVRSGRCNGPRIDAAVEAARKGFVRAIEKGKDFDPRRYLFTLLWHGVGAPMSSDEKREAAKPESVQEERAIGRQRTAAQDARDRMIDLALGRLGDDQIDAIFGQVIESETNPTARRAYTLVRGGGRVDLRRMACVRDAVFDRFCRQSTNEREPNHAHVP